MESTSKTVANKKRLAKNTMLLYIRTIIIMGVNLFASREILRILGVEDYGIYNVVGGFVTMFSLLSGSLSGSISRFITFELGKPSENQLNKIFCTSINIQIVLSIIVVIVAELFGVWFLNNQMNIPFERLGVANWLLQFSIITFVINLISLPYNVTIIAHEDLNIFAYITLVEASLKLVIIYLLIISPIDKLVTYGLLLVVVSLIVRLIYGVYCKHRYQECRYHIVLDKTILKNMFKFAGWNLFGSASYLFNTNGVDIISNIFFGVSINAARGITLQASNAVRQFVINFTTALNPQIIKTYAADQCEECFSTVMMGAKFSFYLVLFFFVPLVIDADYVLRLWLGNVTEFTTLFFRLSLIGIVIQMPCVPLATLVVATGNIKKYFLWMGIWGSLIFPISYVLFYLGAPAYSSYIVYILDYLILVYIRLYLLDKLINFSMVIFYRQVILPILGVLVLAFILPLICLYYLDESLGRLFLILLLGTLSILTAVYTVGLSSHEKESIRNIVRRKLGKIV